jgi:hypothetical protein
LKLVSSFFLFFLIVCSLSAHDRKEGIIVYDNQGLLCILDSNIYANCCSLFDTEMKIENQKIILTQIDTGQKCYCGFCYFDLNYKIYEIQVGNYDYEIWRYEKIKYGYPKDSLYLVFSGKIQITFGFPMPPVFFDVKQSDCKPTAIIEASPTTDNLNISPNPAENSAKISYELEKPSDITILIYDILGRELKRISLQSVNTGKQEYILATSEFQSGIYYCKILITDKIYKNFLLNVFR